MHNHGRRLAFSVVSFLLVSILVWAQGGQTGSISGTVEDGTGALISGATVQVTNNETKVQERSITTGVNGLFVTTLLRPGAYQIEVKAPGFKTYRALLQVRINDITRHTVTLEVGGVEEVVNVEASATQVNTEAPTTGITVDSHTLTHLPLANPNFTFLLTLTPGVVSEPPDVRSAGRGIVDMNVNGQRTTNNSASLEGININDFNLAHFDTIPIPNTNALQEFKISTSLYDASMGSKGGGAVNSILRTGSKSYHWNAYWNHRNDALNARDWFFNSTNPGAKKQKLLQNVLGFSFGGPVPWVDGFFFGNIQGVNARNAVDTSGATARPIVPVFPTAADGSTSAAQLATPSGGWPGLPAPFTAADIDPVAVNILNFQSSVYGGTFLVPRAGQTGCPTGALGATVTCTFSKVINSRALQHTATYDQPLRGGRDKLSFRWFHDNGEDQRPFGAGGTLSQPSGGQQRNRFGTIQHTLQISNRQLNEFRVGYSRFKSAFGPTPVILLNDVGATRPNIAELPDLYQISIGTLFSLGTGANDDRGTISNAFSFSDSWSMVKGKHTLRAGAEVLRFQLNRYNRFATRGILTFGTIPAGATPGAPALSQFQGFLMGRPTATQAAAGLPDRYFRVTDFSLFFQDDFRVTPRFTLNLGLRWENMGFGTELLNRLGNYYPDKAAAGENPFVFPQDVNLGGFTGIGASNAVGNCVIDNCRDKNNWAPRIGFAWDIQGNQKTVLRGGYGIYYQRLSNQVTLQTNLSPPFNVQPIEARPNGLDPNGNTQVLANPFPTLPAASLVNQAVIPQASIFAGVTGNINTTGTPLFRNEDGQLCNGFGGTGVLGGPTNAINCSISLASFTAPVRTLYTPYTQQWNLMVQREITRGWVAEVGYVGSQAVGGIGIFNPFVRLASPTNPITVTDVNGVGFTITTNTAANEPLRHAILGLSRTRGARFTGNIGGATYHSLQSSLSHRFQGGLFFQGSYTWSHTIDNVSGSQSTDELNATAGRGQGGANLFGLGNIDPRLNRARGDFDRPHRLVISYTYELPIPKSGIWGSQAFQGWQISGITYYQSGLPFTPSAEGAAGAWGSGGANAPNFVCSSINDAYTSGTIQDRLLHYIDPACFAPLVDAPFSAVGLRDYGNTPRNAFRGPFQQQWDFSIGKRFTLAEKHAISFRWDIFNMWNKPVFRAPSSLTYNASTTTGCPSLTPTACTLGQITNTTIPARIIQFGLRYEY
jgi:hypothetical protein